MDQKKSSVYQDLLKNKEKELLAKKDKVLVRLEKGIREVNLQLLLNKLEQQSEEIQEREEVN